MQERTAWTFIGRDRHGEPLAPEFGVHEIDGRVVRCYSGDSVSWTRSLHTRAEAERIYQGDLRAMRKNDCYIWPVDA